MKKLLMLLVVLFMLAGCGGKKEEEAAAPAAWKFTNANIRQAMSYALDRDAIVKSLNDGSVAAEGIIPKTLASNPETGVDYRDEVGKLVSYDLDKAKDYYAKGCEELGVDKLTVSLLYGTNEGDSVIKAAELYRPTVIINCSSISHIIIVPYSFVYNFSI